MQEVWKDIKGYEGLYQISNLGRVKSLQKIVNQRRRSCYTKEKILKPNVLWTNYLYVNLYKNKKPKHCLIHKMIAIAFIPNPMNKPFVNHIDGNKQNNSIDNLEWVTSSENNLHAIRNSLRKYETQKKKIKQIKNGIVIAKYNSLTEAHNITGIRIGAISAVLTKRIKSSGGYEWEYDK